MGQTPESIRRSLHHSNFIHRAQASFSVSFLRMNELIPDLYEEARIEPDLHSLCVMCYTLNERLGGGRHGDKPFFTSQFVCFPDWARKTFEELWAERKDELLAQSPKKWINVDQSPGSPFNTILIDPDTQDEITGEPKQP